MTQPVRRGPSVVRPTDSRFLKQGPAGPQGAPGAAGALGATGPQGSAGPAIALSSINFFPYVDVTNAIGGNVGDGMGFNTTAGVQFLPHVAGSVITGMRALNMTTFASSATITATLWSVANGKLATVTMTNPGPGILQATFASPYTVLSTDVDQPLILSLYAGGYFTETAWHGTPLGLLNIPIFASPLYSFGDAHSGPHSHGAVFGFTATGGSGEKQPNTVFGDSRYFAMEPVFQ